MAEDYKQATSDYTKSLSSEILKAVKSKYGASLDMVDIDVPASGWSSTAPYTQTISVDGLRSADMPLLVLAIDKTTTAEEIAAYRKVLQMIDGGNTQDGSIELYCITKKPSVDAKVRLIWGSGINKSAPIAEHNEWIGQEAIRAKSAEKANADAIESNSDAIGNLQNLHKHAVYTISFSGWTASGSLYVYTQTVKGVYSDRPNIYLSPVSGNSSTAEEATAYGQVKYATIDPDTKTLKLYASVNPGSDFAIYVKGVE